MMVKEKIRKSIEELQERIDLYDEHYRGTVPEYYDALKLAVKALRKQLPVSARKESGRSIGGEKHYRYVCPECKKNLRPSTRGKYCPYCGQRIEWEENIK